MIPVFVLIGRPNVGKSTLFNRLTCTRDALVANLPGLTRDRKYGCAKWRGHEFIVIDTGGINSTEKGKVETIITNQSLTAIKEADIVLFMVDGSTGLVSADKDIARHLRIRQKNTVIVVNKIDGIDINDAVRDFYPLGIREIVPIAAAHKRGINSLLERVLLPLVKANKKDTFEIWPNYKDEALVQEEKPFSSQSLLPIKLAIVGRPNVGKSTLANSLLGEERVVVYHMPGTTRDSIYIPMVHEEQNYILIDTAGVRKRGKVTDTVEKFSIIKTLQAIKDANVVLLVIDARDGVADQDLSLLGFILNIGCSIVIVVNKWDGLSREMRKEAKEALDHHLGFINFARVHFISALHGRGLCSLFKSVNEAYRHSTKRVSTALLTRIMLKAVNEYQPPIVRGLRAKLKYAHAGGYNPPIIVIHGTKIKDLPNTYKRYLINYFRRSLEIIGTPIFIQFKETTNPFVSRGDVSTPIQLYRRKRLTNHKPY